MQTPYSGVFIQCNARLFEVEKVIAVEEKIFFFRRYATVKFKEPVSRSSFSLFSAELLSPLKETVALAKKELGKRRRTPTAQRGAITFEILPFFRKKDGEPVFEDSEVEKFRSDPAYVFWEKPIGFRIVKHRQQPHKPYEYG